jgi:CRP/FNR family cyclic AMP-dependent transcriptional regulator
MGRAAQGRILFGDVDGLAGNAVVATRFIPGRSRIAREGEVGTGFTISAGRARVVRDGATIAELGPGEFFGELSLLDGRPRIATVTAVEPTTCLAIASWDFETLLHAQPGVAIAILRGVAGRLREVSDESQHRSMPGG